MRVSLPFILLLASNLFAIPAQAVPDKAMKVINENIAKGNYTEAETMLQGRLSTNGKDATALRKLATILSWQDKYPRALLYYKRYLRLEPKDAAILITVARILSWRKAYSESLDYYDRYLLLKPYDIISFKERALVLFWMGRCDAAISDLEYCIKKDPENETLLDALSFCYLSGNYYKKANYYTSYIRKVFGKTKSVDKQNAIMASTKRPVLTSLTRFLHDSAGYNLISEKLNFRFNIWEWLYLAPYLTYGYSWQGDNYFHLVGGGLGFGFPFATYFNLDGTIGYHHSITPITDEPTVAGELALSFSYYNIFKTTLKGGYDTGFGKLQSAAIGDFVDVVYSDVEFSLNLSRVNLFNNLSFSYFLYNQNPDFYRWTDQAGLTVDIYSKRLFLGYRFYATAFERDYSSFWTPECYHSHSLWGKAVILDWHDKGNLNIELSSGYGSEKSFSGKTSDSFIFGGQVAISRKIGIFSFALTGGFLQSVRDQSTYQLIYAILTMSLVL